MTSPSSSQPKRKSPDEHAAHPEFKRAFDVCVEKARTNLARLAAEPKSAAWATDGNYFDFTEGFFEIGNWTSSFFTGMALLGFETGPRDPMLLETLEQLSAVYRDKVTRHRMDTMHDLGFLYSLFSVALHRQTADQKHRATGLLAADELAKRFCEKGSYFRAWGRLDDSSPAYAGLAIIDSLMNLPLLAWASTETGNPRYAEIARLHAETTLTHFVRPDDSVSHAFRFDPETGEPVGPDNFCGYGVDTQWARGTAWAIYGFALAYRHFRDVKFIDAALRLARKFNAQLDAERVPLWDFKLPANAPRLRDSSAAAVAICGFDEIQVHRPSHALGASADSLLKALCSPDYLDANSDCAGILRAGEVTDGFIPGTNFYKAKNAYTSWGDYFFMEALARRLGATAFFW